MIEHEEAGHWMTSSDTVAEWVGQCVHFVDGKPESAAVRVDAHVERYET